MMRKLLFLLLLLLPLLSYSQRWKRFRYEVIYGIGAANFLGELGGADQVGTDYFKDLELVKTRPALNLGMRYKINQYVSTKAAITYGIISGDDKLTNEVYRSYRNLHFRSPLVEFASTVEFSHMKEKVGHRYRLRGIRGSKHIELYYYGFVGIGAFWFNPKAQASDGKWYALQPLGTEGQGIIGSRKKYHRLQIAFPVGLGFKYALDRKWSVGIEYGLRKTFTDYIDDVSTTYYDPDLLRTYRKGMGNIAVELADPSSKENPGWTVPGQQRGDPSDMDSYMFMILSVNYKLRTSRRGLPKFN